MLHLQPPLPVKFICTFIYSNENIYEKTKEILEKKFSKIDSESYRIDFNFTDYYYPEMSKPLYRRFISFEKLYNPEKFIKIKLFCVKLEKKFAVNEKRIINIDPGYLNEAKLVLTTTKDFSHRIYLGRGVFAEVTLNFCNGKFCDLPTTFPDYRTQGYKDIFSRIRKNYQKAIKSWKPKKR